MLKKSDRGGDAPGRGHGANDSQNGDAPAEDVQSQRASVPLGTVALRGEGQTGVVIHSARALPKPKRQSRKVPASEGGHGPVDTRLVTASLTPSSAAVVAEKPHSTLPQTGDGHGRTDTLVPYAIPTNFDGQRLNDTHKRPAVEARGRNTSGSPQDLASGNHSAGHCLGDTRSAIASGGGDQARYVTQRDAVSPTLIAEIVSLHREHRGLQQMRVAMDLRISAEARWKAAQRIRAAGGELGSKFPPVIDEDKEWVRRTRTSYFAAQEAIETLRADASKRLIREARKLPVYAWAKSVKGFGDASLAAIVGECGDIGSYANPAKLWKRMGLAVFDGKAQGRSKTDWERQGYSPRRRSEAHVIGECLLRSGGPYREVYLGYKERKRAAWLADGIEVVPAAKKKDGHETDGHLHKMALRFAEKRLLLDLWRAWRGADRSAIPNPGSLPAEHEGDAA